MKKIPILAGLFCLGTALFVAPAFADDLYNQSSGSNDWSNGGFWSYTHAPFNGDYGQINNDNGANPSAGTTNIVYRDGDWSAGSGGGFSIYNSVNSGINEFLLNSGSFSTDYVTVGTNGVVTVASGAHFIAWQQLNIQSGGTVTIDGGSLSYSGYSAGHVMSIDGTLIGRNGGTFNGGWDNQDNAVTIHSDGKIVADSGQFVVFTRNEDVAPDSTAYHGLRIDAGGQIVVSNGATFVLNRWNSWGNWFNNTPDNLGGSIILNNGTFAFSRDNSGLLNVDAGLFGYNDGTIAGSGYIYASWKQTASSQIIASNGTLHVFATDPSNNNEATFTPNASDYGTFRAKSGGTMAIDGNVTPSGGFGGAWFVDSSGSLEVASGKSVDLGAAFLPGSNILGTVKVNSGANLTLSSTVSGGGYQDNQGTFLLLSGVVDMPNDTVNPVTGEFTNSVAGAITGNGTLQTGFGQGAGNVNFAIINHGIITATNGTLALNPNDAFNKGGVQNAFDGEIVIANNGTLALVRSQNQWNNSPATSVPNNSGQILMNGGDLGAVSLGGSSTSMTFSNASGGLIKGSGTIDSSWNAIKNTGTIQAFGASPLIVSASTLNNYAGGVVTANTARLIVNGAFNNANGGTFSMISGVGTFNGAVVNSGAWITDPSTNVFNNTYTVSPSGFISAAAGDVYIFHSNFVNQSTQNTSYNTMNATAGGSGASGTKFVFDNTTSSTSSQQYFTAGLALTGGFVEIPSTATATQQVSSFAAVTGFQNNYALDRLEIGNLGTNSVLELSASADLGGSGSTNALFVNDLWLFGSSDLIISNNTILYFVNSNAWTMANITLLGNGQIHQLDLESVASVPEPSVVLLWLCGFGTAYGARRRAKRRSNRG